MTEAQPNAPQRTVDMLRTMYVAARSAITAIAFISFFDRQFTLSLWLHWVVVNWRNVLDLVFAWFPLAIPASFRDLYATCLILFGTSVADLALRWTERNQPTNFQGRPLWQAPIWSGVFTLSLTFFLAGLDDGSKPTDFQLIVVMAHIALIVGITIIASERMFYWLVAFIGVLLLANEVALLFEATVPYPPDK